MKKKQWQVNLPLNRKNPRETVQNQIKMFYLEKLQLEDRRGDIVLVLSFSGMWVIGSPPCGLHANLPLCKLWNPSPAAEVVSSICGILFWCLREVITALIVWTWAWTLQMWHCIWHMTLCYRWLKTALHHCRSCVNKSRSRTRSGATSLLDAVTRICWQPAAKNELR